MTCSNCSADNPSESRFCIRCGSPLEETPAAEALPTAEAPPASDYSVQPTSSEYATAAPAAAAAAAPPPPDPVAALYNEVQYAGFLIRLVAAILDGILVGVVNWMVTVPIYLVAGIPLFSLEDPEFADETAAFKYVAIMGISTIFSIVLGWLYEAVLTSSERQATFGKQAFGIRVTDVNGGRISFARATGRHFAKIISWLTFFIGFLIQPITEKKQALHDIIAGTLVVKKPLRDPRATHHHSDATTDPARPRPHPAAGRPDPQQPHRRGKGARLPTPLRRKIAQRMGRRLRGLDRRERHNRRLD